MYQALYRKWRPTTFDEVVGQEHVTTTLKNEVASGKFSHAYLFTGSRGTGKTTCSKIVAKAINCERPVDGNPCNECASCRGIDDGSVLDVSEIDAASNNGVDNIRQLREEAYFLPASSKFRVYILDECHMLSAGAVNALLKILEEPPEHVIFILATTEIHKVLPTILSRCQRFDFKRIKSRTIADRLLYIAGEEKLVLDGDAALLIARLSDGGMRDALSLLDLCTSYSREVGVETVNSAAGLTGQSHLFELVDAVTENNPASALAVIGAASENSADFSRLCEQLVNHYRNLMIVKTVKEPDELVQGTLEDLERLRGQAKKLSLERMLYSIDVLQDTTARLSRTAFKRTELEMAVVRLGDEQLGMGLEGAYKRIEQLEKAVRSGAAARAAAGSGSPAETVQQPSGSFGAPPPILAPTSGVVGSAAHDYTAEAVGSAAAKVSSTTKARKPKTDSSVPVPDALPPSGGFGGTVPDYAPPSGGLGTTTPPAGSFASSAPPPGGSTTAKSGGAKPAVVFDEWVKVLAELKKINGALYGAMIESSAYTSGDIMLIDCANETFRLLLRTSVAAKESLRDAIFSVTGQKFNLGPYNPERYEVAEKPASPLDGMLKKASELGVPVTIQPQ